MCKMSHFPLPYELGIYCSRTVDVLGESVTLLVVELGSSVIWVMAESFGLNATQSVLDLGTSCISRAIVSC